MKRSVKYIITFDIAPRFVITVFKITNDERCMSECWNRNAHFPRRRLRPNYRRDGFRYDLASTPCAFCPWQCCLLETLASDQNSAESVDSPSSECSRSRP